MSWLFNSGGHCDHCKGGQGTCACAICPQKRSSRCQRQHCPHCKGLPGGCACEYSCAKPGYAQCRPVTTTSSVSSSGALEHCSHCRGREGTCACESGCSRPSSVKCQPRGGVVSSGGSSAGGQHCSHCKGLDGVCACEKGCGKPYAARCRAPSHCSHCKGFDGICACKQGCSKPRDCLCKAPGHCTHCKGGQGGCACKEGCPKPSSAQCVSSSIAEVAAVAGLLGRVSLEERVGIQPQISVNLINVCFAVDASGSMAGSSWNKARQGVNQCLGQLSDSDYCSVITFNDKVEVIDCDTKRKLNLSKFHSMQPNGNTALYDAVAQAVTAALQIRKLVDAATPLPVVTYVIILTDGEDNRSRLSLQEAQVLLQQANKLRNLKIILAGINLSGTGKQAVLKLASVGDDDIRFIDLQSASDIDNLFEHISLELKAVRSTRLVVS